MSRKPTIDEIARQIPHILEYRRFGRNRAYSGVVDFYRDEMDIKGDGTLWAMAEFEVAYNWTHDPGDRDTPPISDFDVVEVDVKNANFNTDDGEEVEVAPEQAKRILVDYFWANDLQHDDVLADKVHDRADMGSYEYD